MIDYDFELFFNIGTVQSKGIKKCGYMG